MLIWAVLWEVIPFFLRIFSQRMSKWGKYKKWGQSSKSSNQIIFKLIWPRWSFFYLLYTEIYKFYVYHQWKCQVETFNLPVPWYEATKGRHGTETRSRHMGHNLRDAAVPFPEIWDRGRDSKWNPWLRPGLQFKICEILDWVRDWKLKNRDSKPGSGMEQKIQDWDRDP